MSRQHNSSKSDAHARLSVGILSITFEQPAMQPVPGPGYILGFKRGGLKRILADDAHAHHIRSTNFKRGIDRRRPQLCLSRQQRANHSGLRRDFGPDSGHLPVTVSVTTHTCHYGIAYRRSYVLSTNVFFQKSLRGPLCGL